MSRRLTDDERGLTLVELLVTMMVLGLVLAMATGLYISAAQSVSSSQKMNDATRVAANAMEELGRVIRVGTDNARSGSTTSDPAFTVAGRETLTMMSNVDVDPYMDDATRPARPTMVRFQLTANRQLVETRWLPAASGRYWVFGSLLPGNATSTRNLGGTFRAAGTDAPLFTYFAEDGTVIPFNASGVVAAGQLDDIASVQITVKVGSETSTSADPVVLQGTVLLPNLVITKVTS